MDVHGNQRPTKADLFETLERELARKPARKPARDPRWQGIPKLGFSFGRTAFERFGVAPRSKHGLNSPTTERLVRVFRPGGSGRSTWYSGEQPVHKAGPQELYGMYLQTGAARTRAAEAARKRGDAALEERCMERADAALRSAARIRRELVERGLMPHVPQALRA